MKLKFDKAQLRKTYQTLKYNFIPIHDFIAPVVGLHVKEDQSLANNVIVITLFLVNLIPSSVETYSSLGDINALAPCLPVFGILAGFLVVVITLLIKRKTYMRLLFEMRPEFDEEFSIASDYTKTNLMLATIRSVILVTNTCIVLSLYVTDPLVSDKWILLFPSWYPFDISVPSTYWILFAVQLCTGIIIGICVFAVEIYFLYMAEHICMHFDNLCNKLQFRLKTLGEKHNGSDTEESFDDFVCNCVSRHNALLERVSMLDDMFSNFLLLHFLFFILTMSVTALEFMSATNEVTPIYIMKNTFLFLGGCMELYFPSIAGTRLGTAQTAVSEAVFSETVLLCSESARKSLSIMSIRAERPVMITIGGFKLFDVVSFSETLGAVYTIFTMLIQFKQGGHKDV